MSEPRRALVRRPSPRLAEGLVTHIERDPVDVDRAMSQWENYVAALREEGWEIVEVPEARDCPDSVFVEDVVVVREDVALVCRPGAPEREAETAGLADFMTDLGFRTREVAGPGTLDGGDVLRVGDLNYVGFGGRTNEVGIGQLRAHFARIGMRTESVPVKQVLHLKSAITALPDHTIIGFPANVTNQGSYEPFEAMPEEAGSHVVVLDEDSVLMSASAPESKALLEGRGLRVVTVDISEFEKLEGCVTCLSVRLGSDAD